MEVILKQDVKSLGYKDDVIKVRPGYARNYLFPKALAGLATVSSKKVLQETVKQRAFKEQKLKAQADALAERIKSKPVLIPTKVGEAGRIFGAVTALQVAEGLKKLGVEVDRKSVTMLQDEIKTVGTYTATVKLHKDVIVPIAIEVIAE